MSAQSEMQGLAGTIVGGALTAGHIIGKSIKENKDTWRPDKANKCVTPFIL